MVLVDTSVWIEVFRRPSRITLEEVIPFEEVVTCLPVVQEVLQGVGDPRAFARIRDSMLALPLIESPLSLGTFETAIDLYRTARRAGVTVRSSVDCLIAACALRHSIPVLHQDRDFAALSRVSALEAISI